MFLKRFISALVLLALCRAVFPQGAIDSTQYLNEVVIVANSYKEVIPSQKLSGAELQRLNSHSVADAIRYFSGVQLKDYGGIGGLKTVDIRSMGSNQLGVFYDGIQLGNAQNGQVDLGKFSMDNIEEITLYNGQKSEIFQPAKDFGSAGTIYLRTRRPRFEDGKKNNLKAIFRSGSFDLINPSLLWEHKLSSSVNSSLNVEYVRSTGKYKYRYRRVNPDRSVAWDTTAIRQNGDIESFRAEGVLSGYLDNGKWQAKAYYYDSEKGIPGAIVNNVWKHAQRQWDRNFFTQASFQKPLFPGYELMVNLKYAHDYMRYFNPDTTLMYIDNDFMQQEMYASIANKYSILPNWEISLSADYQWNKLSSGMKNFAYPKRNTTLLAFASTFEWQRFKVLASVLGTFVNGNVSVGKSPRDEVKYTPAAFLSYQPFSKHNFVVRAFYKRIFRMPTFNDLYYTDIGYIALKPEFATQYNAGFLYTKDFNRIFHNFNLKMDAYYNKVSDKIVSIPKGSGQYRWMIMNLGKVEIRGIDVSTHVETRLATSLPQFHASLNYTYQKALDFSNPKDTGDGGSWGGQIAYIPKHSGSAILGGLYKSWDMNYSFIYVGERYHNSANIRENYEQPWYTSDLSLGKTFYSKPVKFSKLNRFKTGFKMKISAEVNNLLNQYYDVVVNYPMPGRNYKLILKIEI